VVDALGERVPVIQTVFSPISVGDYLVGRDKRRLIRELRQHPEVVLPARLPEPGLGRQAAFQPLPLKRSA